MSKTKFVVGLTIFAALGTLFALWNRGDTLNRYKRQADATAAAVTRPCAGFLRGNRCIEIIETTVESELSQTLDGLTFYKAWRKCTSFTDGYMADVNNEVDYSLMLNYISSVFREENISSTTIWLNITSSQQNPSFGVWCKDINRPPQIAKNFRCVGLILKTKEGGTTPSPGATPSVAGQEIEHCLFTVPCFQSWKFRPLCSFLQI